MQACIRSKETGKWYITPSFNGVQHYIGTFPTQEEAEKAYCLVMDIPLPKQKVRQKTTPKPVSKKRKRTSFEEGDKRVKFNAYTRNEVCYRQGWRCNICTGLLDPALIIDHIVPLSLGGTNSVHSNLQALCSRCDRLKTGTIDKFIKKRGETMPMTAQEILEYQSKCFKKISKQQATGSNMFTGVSTDLQKYLLKGQQNISSITVVGGDNFKFSMSN